MKYESTKTYGHEQGLSCCFRQWRADSHCNRVHGYALAFRFVFGCETLDAKGWVVDFGGLKGLKEALKEHFDHTWAVALDDPMRDVIISIGVGDVRTFPDGVGCERFACMAWWLAWQEVQNMNRAEGSKRLFVISAECMEHAGNSAIFYGPKE